jgi:uncharacterized protein GlcG (DUF336 family)
MALTLDQAKAVLTDGAKRAETVGIAVCIAVLDDAGHLKAFSRMDGAWLGSVDVAMSKARTSVLFRAETQVIGEVCRAGAEAEGLERSNGGLVTFAGGIPLLCRDGALIGAVGVSGGQVAQDFEIAQAAAAALETLEPSTVD